MTWTRLAALMVAVSLHAGAFYLIKSAPVDNFTFDEGEGNDALSEVTTVDLDGMDLFTQAAQEASIDADAAKPEEKEQPKPDEAKEPQKPDVPLQEEVDKSKSQQAPSQAQHAQDQQVAKAAIAAKKNKQWSAYEQALHKCLERFKKKPDSDLSGKVLVTLTIAPSGDFTEHWVTKSSGNEKLDELALASVERSSPCPPIPPEISTVPMTLSVPFEYVKGSRGDGPER